MNETLVPEFSPIKESLERIHLGGSPGFTTRFDHVGDLVINLQEGHGTAGTPTSTEFFLT